MGIPVPKMYSIRFVTVDSWNGCMSEESSQKKPLLKGSPIKKKRRTGSAAERENKLEKRCATSLRIGNF